MTASSWPQERQQAVALLESQISKYIVHSFRARERFYKRELTSGFFR